MIQVFRGRGSEVQDSRILGMGPLLTKGYAKVIMGLLLVWGDNPKP